MDFYSIDCYNPETNSFYGNDAVWSTDPEKCVYADYMREILNNGGSYDAPDGCTYSIHEEE